MYENFLKIEKKKQHRIINISFEIFATHGYKKASTLDICEKAKISKGALFHYFGTKRNLYFYLFELGIKLLMEEIHIEEVCKNRDFFARMEEIVQAKMQAMKQYPYIYSFFVKAYGEVDEAVNIEVKQRIALLANDPSLLLDNIDRSKFRKEINLTLLSTMIVDFTLTFMQSMLTTHQEVSFETIVQAFTPYMKMLKENFYKEEYL